MNFASVRSLLILPLLLGTYLGAQVDPRLAKSKTDVLDVYFGSTSTGPNPEIISVIDNSASMATLYWSRYYWADTTENWHRNPWITSGDNRIVPVVYKSGSGSTVSITVAIHPALNAGGASLAVNSSKLVTGGLLIMPNGNPVTYAEAGNSDDPKDWIQRASHVRFALTSNNSPTTYTFNGTTYDVPNRGVNPVPLSTGGGAADYTSASPSSVQGAGNVRVVDIPLPWAAFDAVPYYEGQNLLGVGPDGTTSPGTYARPLLSTRGTTPVWPSGDYSTAVAKKHPQHAYVYDPGLTPPTSYDAWYEVDAVWSATGTRMYNAFGTLVNADGILQTSLSWSGGTPSGAYGKIGAFNYTADYLWWCFFGQDARNQSGGIHPGGAYNGGMVDRYAGSNAGGYTVPDVRENGAGFVLHANVAGNGLPCLTKFMAIKKALFQVYVKNEASVSWCTRFLNNDPSISSGYSSDSLSGNPGDRQLMLLNPPNSSNQPDQNSIRYIITMQALTNTPLNAALMNAYAQMADRTHTVFNTTPASCTKSFLIVLSDGAPTDTGSRPADPYKSGVSDGNAYVQSNAGSLRGGSLYNLATIAAVAAHHPLISSNNWDIYGGNPGNVSLPWSITTRGGTTAAPRYTNTLTIGVGLSGTLMDPAGTQRAMYAAALYGWEKRTDWNIDSSNTALFNPPDPYLSTPTATSKTINPFFFDANDPDNLAGALDSAISLTRVVTNTMGAPVAPLVGLSVGKQIYLGIFNTPDGPVWTGDLLMTGLRVNGNTVQILDNSGAVSTNLDHTSAVWSASNALNAKSWKNRWLFTLKPNPSNLPTGPTHPGAFTTTLLNWNEGTSTADLPNSVLGVSTDQDRRSLIRFMMGASTQAQADTAAVTSLTANRLNMMGDIINSTPAILEFPMSSIPSGSTLASYDTSGLQNVRFRVIMVGDNQGIFHAFGEISGFNSSGLLQGTVDELWGFIPPDFLIGLNAWRNGDSHIYLMDGSPIIYFNEVGTPNGVVDGTDIVRVTFGLGKGGRSVYCLTFTNNDPTQPVISWMIRPDEKAAATSGSDLAIKNMGFSTSKPVPSRIQSGTTLKDVVFIGGGLSTLDVDNAFSASTTATPPGYGTAVKLGRSILAVNVYDGTIEHYWDFSTSTTVGCIPAPVVPFEVIPGSFRTQRVYFSDTSGSVSVLGARASSGLRTDTSDVNSWSLRKIFTPYYPGTPVSTTPAVFYLPYGYPVARTTDPKPIVPAVGVTFVTGDRNDPMDNDTVNPNNNNNPNRNRLITILDRQDSADITGQLGRVDTYGFTDKPAASGATPDLADLTTVSSSSDTLISPIDNYLKTSFGYQLQMTLGTTKPAAAGIGKFYQKGVTAPTVLNGALFFSLYTPNPTSSLCGGSGTTYTYRMCDVLNPIYNSGGTQAGSSICSGWYSKYNDIPSELASVGLGAVIQAGEVQDTNNQGQGVIQVQPVPGAPLNKILRPRAWRIVR